ncbi:MAG: hypothetical protein C4K58_03410 [Flavobacteriaceae bacterium]|nr:MAG: hypothetical protein C4K58_03410 [Flavobacteriaceae bacterium]
MTNSFYRNILLFVVIYLISKEINSNAIEYFIEKSNIVISSFEKSEILFSFLFLIIIHLSVTINSIIIIHREGNFFSKSIHFILNFLIIPSCLFMYFKYLEFRGFFLQGVDNHLSSRLNVKKIYVELLLVYFLLTFLVSKAISHFGNYKRK